MAAVKRKKLKKCWINWLDKEMLSKNEKSYICVGEDVVTQPWGGNTCSLTTIDGYTINIFE